MIKKHFNKNLVMPEKDEQRFQSSNKCWIWKLFDVGDNEVRDHCHVTGKYRGSAHWSCNNNNLKLTKKVSLIFHNLKGCDINLIMQEIGKFDIKGNFIPNGLEKYMAFTINSNWVFIDSIQFMHFSLAALVKNLSDNNFKYLSQELSRDLLELVRQKGVCPYEYIDSFKQFSENKLPNMCTFFSFLKDECISEKDYLHAIDVWNVFKMKTMGDYHDI